MEVFTKIPGTKLSTLAGIFLFYGLFTQSSSLNVHQNGLSVSNIEYLEISENPNIKTPTYFSQESECMDRKAENQGLEKCPLQKLMPFDRSDKTLKENRDIEDVNDLMRETKNEPRDITYQKSFSESFKNSDVQKTDSEKSSFLTKDGSQMLKKEHMFEKTSTCNQTLVRNEQCASKRNDEFSSPINKCQQTATSSSTLQNHPQYNDPEMLQTDCETENIDSIKKLVRFVDSNESRCFISSNNPKIDSEQRCDKESRISSQDFVLPISSNTTSSKPLVLKTEETPQNKTLFIQESHDLQIPYENEPESMKFPRFDLNWYSETNFHSESQINQQSEQAKPSICHELQEIAKNILFSELLNPNKEFYDELISEIDCCFPLRFFSVNIPKYKNKRIFDFYEISNDELKLILKYFKNVPNLNNEQVSILKQYIRQQKTEKKSWIIDENKLSQKQIEEVSSFLCSFKEFIQAYSKIFELKDVIYAIPKNNSHFFITDLDFLCFTNCEGFMDNIFWQEYFTFKPYSFSISSWNILPSICRYSEDDITVVKIFLSQIIPDKTLFQIISEHLDDRDQFLCTKNLNETFRKLFFGHEGQLVCSDLAQEVRLTKVDIIKKPYKLQKLKNLLPSNLQKTLSSTQNSDKSNEKKIEDEFFNPSYPFWHFKGKKIHYTFDISPDCPSVARFYPTIQNQNYTLTETQLEILNRLFDHAKLIMDELHQFQSEALFEEDYIFTVGRQTEYVRKIKVLTKPFKAELNAREFFKVSELGEKHSGINWLQNFDVYSSDFDHWIKNNDIEEIREFIFEA